MINPPAVPGEVVELVRRLNVSRESWERIEGFVALLFQWQARINLVSPASLPDIWMRHVVDSLQLIPLLPAGTKCLADLGSGSGFPALPVAIASGIESHPFESNLKKAAFLSEALRRSGAAGKVHSLRLDGRTKPPGFEPEIVTARALAPLDTLLGWASPFIEQGAKALFHKGQDVDAELTQAAKNWKISFEKHSSLTDSRSVILEIKEAYRV